MGSGTGIQAFPILSGRVALVTGATRGIGKAIAHEIVQSGSRVAVAGRDASSAIAVAEELGGLGGGVMGVQLDVAKPSSVLACVDQVIRRFSCIDILVNNAGVFQRGATLDLADTDFNDCLDVNLTGMWRVVQATLPHLRRQGGGRIVNIASSGGRRGVGFAPAYCASKAGVISLTQSLALALGADKINVNAVCPGAIETDMRRKIRQLGVLDGVGPTYALLDPLTARDVAHAVVFLVSDYAKSITGQTLNVDRGFLFN